MKIKFDYNGLPTDQVKDEFRQACKMPLGHEFSTKQNTVIQGDCLEVMKEIPDKSVDMILCDLPYGTTACKWDTIIPFEPLWEQYKRIIKDNGAIVLTASQPFTSALVVSNLDMFKYSWIWQKAVGSNFATLKYQPMKEHEDILIFGKGKTIYNPIMETRKGSGGERVKHKYNALKTKTGEANGGLLNTERTGKYGELRNPSSVQYFNNREDCRGLHPTQKPVALFEYLIKTYTNEGDTVLDNCAGSGTTGVACKNLNRNYILIEKEPEYVEIINKRLGSPVCDECNYSELAHASIPPDQIEELLSREDWMEEVRRVSY